MRPDNRRSDQLRETRIVPKYLMHPEGSVLIEAGRTKVICTASVEDRVPPFLRNTGKGWVTAEYGMLPRATNTRTQREASAGKVGGRTQEIQRLIGRSLRAAVDMGTLGPRTLTVDCDVIQADGGTRTASITGGFVAVGHALKKLKSSGVLSVIPQLTPVAAVSVGIVKGEVRVDLDYVEDSAAEVDLNLVANAPVHEITQDRPTVAAVDWAGYNFCALQLQCQNYDYRLFTTIGYSRDAWNLSLRHQYWPELQNNSCRTNPTGQSCTYSSLPNFGCAKCIGTSWR